MTVLDTEDLLDFTSFGKFIATRAEIQDSVLEDNFLTCWNGGEKTTFRPRKFMFANRRQTPYIFESTVLRS